MRIQMTSLSAGKIIRRMLIADEDVTAITNKVYPVVTDAADLPYIIYRRASVDANPVKQGYPSADKAQIEIMCCAASYDESIALAEAVRKALDCQSYTYDGVVMRSCVMTDASEAWQDDAYVQNLVFNVKM